MHSTTRARSDVAGLLAHDVTVRRGRRLVLSGLSLRLPPGRVWGLLGPNGAGKSTLLEAIVGTLPLESGTLSVDGARLDDLDARARARRVALVGRETGELSLSVRALTELGRFAHRGPLEGLRKRDEELVDAALADAGVSPLASRSLTTLSQGEAQRAHFARALAQSPSLLLLDEATAHVDLAHREEMLARLRRFADSGGTALAALHDVDLAARHADGLVVLHEGRVVAVGAPREVLTTQLLRDVFGVDAQLVEDERGSSLRVYGALRAPPENDRKAAP